MKYYLFALTFLFLFSCKNEPSTSSSPTENSKSITTTLQPIEMLVYLDNLRLRDAAGEKANEIARLPENTKVFYSGELSNFTTKIKLRGMPYDEPWLKIKTEQGMEGWIYAGGVKPATNDSSEAIRIIEKMRLHSFFGKELGTEIEVSNNALTEAPDSKTFAKAYEKCIVLRDSFAFDLGDKIPIDDPYKLPSMSWLENAMQGFTTSLVAEGTQFYLFANYKLLSEMANKTIDNEDNEFIKLQMSIYHLDSIEHFYPVWFMQTWDYGGHSLLGEGHHFQILKKVNELLEKKSPFKKSLEETKKEILDDIFDTEKYVTYWYKKEKILSEIDQIIAANFVSLSQQDVIALKTRRKMFAQHKANDIKINQRSGE